MAKTPSNDGKPWSRGDDARLRDLAHGNTPTRVIALKLQRTPAAVYTHASQIGQTLRPTNQRPYGSKK